MTDTHDYLALDWVKGEIQETLNQSQQALEAFVENPDDSTRMRFCQTYLHQVYGTLQMVEFYGAALLAEEMEKLSQALLDGNVAQVNDAQETLMRAILQLPPYLDRVQASRRDLPVVLLPLLNDLRAARGEKLLSETSLFKPDLASGAGKGAVPLPVAEDPDFPALARKIRQMYQIALLGVIRGEKLKESYGYMGRVFSKLHHITGDAPMFPVWEVGLALVEALAAGAIQPGTSVKSVLGHIDRLMREVSTQGAVVLSKTPPAELLKNLLYFIAKCEADTPRIVRLKKVYRLADALPSESMISEERARMSGPDQAAMASVVQALSEELNKVKDALEQFIHSSQTDGEQLKPQAQLLKQVGDTVAVLGLGQPRVMISDQVEALEAMASGERSVDHDALMDVAGALLEVESALQGVIHDHGSSSRENRVLAAAPDHVTTARDAVIRECRAGLEEGKDGIVEFIASQWDQSHLASVPGKLSAVRGGLEMIGLNRPAKILRQCVSYIEAELLGDNVVKPEWRSMDTLADAITSVEYYLERLTDDPETTDDILDVARTSVAHLGYQIEDEEFGRSVIERSVESSGVAGLASEEIDIALPQVSIDEPVVEVPEKAKIKLRQRAQEEGEDLPEISDDDLLAFEEAEVERMRLEEQDAAAAEADKSEPALVSAVPEEEDDLIDDEIIEIFVEEAGEVLDTLAKYFPRWVANQEDEEALVEFRRAFHTLKGSGRMVGALTVGELAWSIENMVNRVIDRTIEATPILIALVQEVHKVIPALIEAFSTRTSDPYDVEALKQAANTLAEGGLIDEVPDVTASLAVASGVQLEVKGEDDSGAWVLQDIFRNEALTNLQLLRDWLSSIDADLSMNPVSDDVHRALHTLKGSARMAEIEGIAALAEPAERFTKALINSGLGADRDAVAMIADVTALLEQGVEHDPHLLEGAAEVIQRLQLATEALQSDSGKESTDHQHLMSAFLSEGMSLIMDADSLLVRWSEQPEDTSDIEKLRNELSLLSDSARSAGVQEVTELAGALAHCYSAVAERKLEWSDALHSVVVRAHEALITMMDYFAAGQSLVRDEVLLMALAQSVDGGPDDSPDGDQLLSESIVDAEETEVSSAHDLDRQDVDLPDEDGLEQLGDIDQELLEIFLEEAEEVLESASNALDTWESGDSSLMSGLQRDLHTLKGGARMAGIAAIGDLAHELESLYEGFNTGQFEADAELFNVLHQCHDSLIEMVEMVRDQGACRKAPALVAAIDGFLADKGIAIDELHSAVDDISAEPVSEGATGSLTTETDVSEFTSVPVELGPEPELNVPVEEDAASAPPPERDEELVEIFLEEADEILESASVSLESWMEAPDNLVEVHSLQRDLHTLKGGARMAEVQELGDLGHELENLYEGLAGGSLKPSPVLFQLLHACHDRLAVMVEGVKARQSLVQAQDLIAAIHGFIADPAGFVLPSLQGAASVAATASAAVPSTAEVGREADSAVPQSDIDPDILNIFIEEAAELRANLDKELEGWLSQPSAAQAELVKRALHTLKGGARLAGLQRLGDASHGFEQVMECVELRHAPSAETVEQMRGWQKEIHAAVKQLQSMAVKLVPATAGAAKTPPLAKTKSGQQRKQDEQQAAKRNAAAQQPQEMVRIGADVLESLVNLAGETTINRGRVEQGITEFSVNVSEMGNTIERLYDQLRRLDVETESQIMSNYQQGLETGQYDEDFDPLEMDQYSGLHQITKQLSESASDLLDLKNTLIDRSRDTETLLLQQSRINTELQEKLMRTRMVPFSRLVPRLRRIVRQVSGEINKSIEFDVVNPEGELDRTLMERVVAPLEHMLRNAVDHGIEDAAGRAAAGKDATGKVTLELSREGGEVVLILSDDGKGIDTDAVRRKAVERDLIDADAQLTEQEIQQFIFNAGFSTADKVTQISGRGVGMDVVASEIKQMGGSVTIDSTRGVGTRFYVRLPFTLAMNRALMIRVGDDQYAIPLNQIDGIVRISPYELESYFGEETKPFVYGRQQYELAYMGGFVHGHQVPSHLMHSQVPLPVLLIRSTDHQVAVLVDGLTGSREVVVKSVGPQLSMVAGISGATILGDGSVVIILDIHSLIRAAHMQRQHHLERSEAGLAVEPTLSVEQVPVEPVRTTPLIMVTDDSVTVRKVTTRLLERNGYEVITAKDGIDAVTKLEEHKPDLMLLDIEMPRMDGFEVATHVRHEERLKNVPIIMITSRTGDKHRDRAFDIGVNSYMGKPFQEGELLSTIRELLASARETIGS